jgi:hypothetical protein
MPSTAATAFITSSVDSSLSSPARAGEGETADSNKRTIIALIAGREFFVFIVVSFFRGLQTMYRVKTFVKQLLPALAFLALGLCTAADAGETAGADAPKPHMMYFDNPSCRLCTETNIVIDKVEKQYGNVMSYERIDIADEETGTDNVLYMFDLMDEMKLPESDTTTLLVFLGTLETVDGELYFTPKRALVDGDEIIPKLEAEVADFLKEESKVAYTGESEKGGSLGLSRQASFFLQRNSLCLAHSA